MMGVYAGLSALSLIWFMSAWLGDPGYLINRHRDQGKLLHILKNVEDASEVCARCEV